MPTVKMEVKKKIGGVCVEQLKCTILPKYWEFARIICREDNNKNCCKKECVDCNYNHLIEMTERHSLLRMDTDTERGDVKNIEMSPSIPTGTPRINHEKEIYPYCIVWTPLPMISWFLPFIGHTGIGDSRGVLYDFAGPYHIGVGHLSFSKPTKYLQLDPSKCFGANWDEGVREGCDVYSKRMHNICCDNCHSHVAKCLNVMGYNKNSAYGMVQIGVWMFFSGRWVSFSSFVRTYSPFAIIVTLIVLASSGVFS